MFSLYCMMCVHPYSVCIVCCVCTHVQPVLYAVCAPLFSLYCMLCVHPCSACIVCFCAPCSVCIVCCVCIQYMFSMYCMICAHPCSICIIWCVCTHVQHVLCDMCIPMFSLYCMLCAHPCSVCIFGGYVSWLIRELFNWERLVNHVPLLLPYSNNAECQKSWSHRFNSTRVQTHVVRIGRPAETGSRTLNSFGHPIPTKTALFDSLSI